MRKHRAALHVTFYEDSKTWEAYVEHDNVAGRWELRSDDSSTSWSVISAQFDELLNWVKEMMAEYSASMSRSSDLG